MSFAALRRSAQNAAAMAEKGFSLVEIMVALVAGLILAAGISQIFLSTKQTFGTRDQLSRLQENSRFAFNMLTHDARMAGSLGCHSRTGEIQNTLNDASSLYYDFRNPVGGFEANNTAPGDTYSIPSSHPSPSSSATLWTPGLPAVSPGIVGSVIAGTDILVLRGRIGRSSALVSASATGIAMQINAGSVEAGECSGGADRINGLCAGHFVLVADCTLSRIFQATAVTHTGEISHDAGASPGNACTQWNAAPCPAYSFPTAGAPGVGAPAEVSGVATIVYYIGQRTPPSSGPAPGPSLYRRVVDEAIGANTNQALELVEGVENMQILYGVDLGAGGTRFVTADKVTDWSKVTSIRLGLLMRTPEETGGLVNTATYQVNGATIDPFDDRHLRRVATTTISLRNTSP